MIGAIIFVTGVTTGVWIYGKARKATQRRQIARGRKALLAHMSDEDRRESNGKS